MNKLLDRLQNFKKHDAWSDLVSSSLGDLGITTADRNALQPAVNAATAAVLGNGLPPATQGQTFSAVISTVKANPIPALLIAGVLAFLLLRK